MTIKELITELNKISAEFGDGLKVIVSTDGEGNEYSTIDKRSLSIVDKTAGDNKLEAIGVVIYPWIEGFKNPCDACRKV